MGEPSASPPGEEPRVWGGWRMRSSPSLSPELPPPAGLDPPALLEERVLKRKWSVWKWETSRDGGSRYETGSCRMTPRAELKPQGYRTYFH